MVRLLRSARELGRALIEGLYFCVVTLTTVGYGDFTPTSAGTQIFTIVYILTGFGVLVALLTSVAEQYLSLKAEGAAGRDHVDAERSIMAPRLLVRALSEPRSCPS